MLDLATEQGALEFCESTRGKMELQFAISGRFEMNGYSFGAFVFRTHTVLAPDEMPGAGTLESVAEAWKTGEPLPHPQAELIRLPRWVMDAMPAEHHTAFFSHVVRTISEKSRAIGVVTLGEMWFAMPDHVPGETAEQARSKLPKSLADYEGRKEGLFVSLEHKVVGKRMWTTAISRNPTRLGPWELYPQPFETEGNFCGLVP